MHRMAGITWSTGIVPLHTLNVVKSGRPIFLHLFTSFHICSHLFTLSHPWQHRTWSAVRWRPWDFSSISSCCAAHALHHDLNKSRTMHPFCSSFGLSHAHQLNKSRFDLTDLPIYLSAPVHPSRVGEPKICTRIASHALSRGVGSLIQNARQASNIGRDDFTQSQIEAPVPTTKAHQSSSCHVQKSQARCDIFGQSHNWLSNYTSIYKYRILLSSIKCVKYWCHLICF